MPMRYQSIANPCQCQCNVNGGILSLGGFQEESVVDGVITNPSSEDFNRNAFVEGFDRDPPVEGFTRNPSCG
eukprot:177717-Pyramimonas_sp.AAC.1